MLKIKTYCVDLELFTQFMYSVVSWYQYLPHLPADSSGTLLSAPDPRNVLYWQHLDEAEANMADLWRRNLYGSLKTKYYKSYLV